MKIAPNTNVIFIENSGFNGGAIALITFSVIVLGNDTSFLFISNTAVSCGGAIYSYSTIIYLHVLVFFKMKVLLLALHLMFLSGF